MKITLDIDQSYNDEELVIKAPALTPELSRIISLCTGVGEIEIPAYREDSFKLFTTKEIYRIYAQGGKVFAETTDGVYEVKSRLYELEEKLEHYYFVRISKSELINLKQVARFESDPFNGLSVVLKNGQTTYVSRRYVASLKERIGV